MSGQEQSNIAAFVPEEGERLKDSGVDRRRESRYSCILKASRVGGETIAFQPAWFARVLNVSKGGIALHLGEPFGTDTVLTIRLHTHAGVFSPPLEVRVLHLSRQGNGTWFLGASFTTPLTERELELLLG
jgi:hypothetical protein